MQARGVFFNTRVSRYFKVNASLLQLYNLLSSIAFEELTSWPHCTLQRIFSLNSFLNLGQVVRGIS